MGNPSDRLTLFEAQQVNTERAMIWHPEGINSWTLPEWFTALAGEVGELGGAIKELCRNRDGLPGKGRDDAELHQDLADEIADVFAYLMLLAEVAGFDLAEIHVDKFNRVTERHGFDFRKLHAN